MKQRNTKIKRNCSLPSCTRDVIGKEPGFYSSIKINKHEFTYFIIESNQSVFDIKSLPHHLQMSDLRGPFE